MTLFQQELANLLGTSISNIILVAGETDRTNNTMTVTVKFLSTDSRTQLQDRMQNLTTSEQDDLGIVAMSAAPSATTAEAPVDEDWTLIFVALAFMGFIGIVGFFAYRKISKEMKEKKKDSKQSMESFKESLMSQYAMDYGEDAGGLVGGGAAATEMLTTSNFSPRSNNNTTSSTTNKNNNNTTTSANKKKSSSSQKIKQPRKEYYYDDEGNPFYYDENGDAWYCEEGEGPTSNGVSIAEQEEL